MSKKNLFGWGKKEEPVKEEPSYKVKDIEVLLEKIKEFNAGAIDAYLTNHVDKVFEDWKKTIE